MSGLINVDLSSLAKSISEPIVAGIQKGVDLATIQKDTEKNLQDFFDKQNSAQVDVDKIEAGSSNLFIAGWRPAIAWICVFGVAWAFVIYPVLQFLNIGTPKIDSAGLMELVMALLGMAGLRSFDKLKGLTK